MHKIRFSSVSALLISLLFSITAFGADSGVSCLPENNADMRIYRTDFDNLYQINIQSGGETSVFYEKAADGGIFVLMVNGSFVPSPSLLMAENTLYISADKLSRLIGNEADPSTFELNTYTFKKGDSSIQVRSYSRTAVINGVETDIGAFSAPLYDYEGMDENIYVPLRYIVETLGGKVEYVPDFENAFGDGLKGKRDASVNIAVVEMPAAGAEIYSVEYGLNALISSSKETYEYVKSYLKESGRSFGGTDLDYDPADIKYIGNMGRYYMYHLSGFEGLPLMINKYTGEMFSGKPGLPFVNISKGFPNIGWLYQ